MLSRSAKVAVSLLLGGSIFCLVALPAPSSSAPIDPSIKKECMKAVDFAGCVKTLSSDERVPSGKRVEVDINRINATGNTCPSGWAYVGGGYCLQVGCGFVGHHDPRIAGKGWSCKGLGWLSKDLVLHGDPVRATYSPSCPDVEPEIGRTSSCHNGLAE